MTRKVSYGVARIKLGLDEELHLGNLAARRDWGFALDYVRAMWMMLQQDEPEDFVVGTGIQHSVEDLVELAFGHVGLDWRKHVVRDERLLRPADVEDLVADPRKAREKLAWEPSVDFAGLVKMMVDADLELLRSESQERNAR